MRIKEEIDKNFSIQGNNYVINRDSNILLLKRFCIKKEKKLLYSFVGGMWYSRDRFSLESEISLPYPFSTYYITKVLDKECDGSICRSLYYVKTPLIVLQFEDKCICVEFDPIVKVDDVEVLPFVSLSEDERYYTISFYLSKELCVKEKKYAWLGFGKKKKIIFDCIKPGKKIGFSAEIREYRDWREAVRDFVESRIADKVDIKDAEKIFENAKNVLWRSYDSIYGTFLQLPWSDAPSFTFVNSSYSLLSFEAVRLNYFSYWYSRTKDRDFLEWSLKLKDLFKNQELVKRNLKKGKGIAWYNMTNLTRKGLEGFFYLDCGYGGYPGGQGTIAFNILRYLESSRDDELEKLVRDSLEYIMSTQKENGSWPMAIHQEGLIRFRPENLENYETYCGTAECVRALLLGYKRFKDKKMLESAVKGLNYLKNDYPVCYNGLRDIGINEAEAFSAVSVIEAFLDAYETLGDKEYLDNALNYSYYALTWFYFYDTKNLKMSFNFHPISESITPRVSPYETALIVSTYLRLYGLTKDRLWEKMARLAFREVTRWVDRNGGLCEGVFPRFLSGFEPLPMEQTFATVELMRAATNFFEFSECENDKEKTDEKIRIVRDGNEVVVLYKDKDVLRFDAKRFKIVFIRGCKLNDYGVSFSFYDSYKKKWVSKLKKKFRGKYGKYILGLGEIGRFIKGVYPPRRFERIKIDPIGKYVKKFDINIENNSANIFCETDLHRISCRITAYLLNKRICISFDPIVINVLEHDISCKKVFFPIIGSRVRLKKNGELCFDGFNVKGDFKEIIEGKNLTAVDQTLATNWTHGSVYKGGFTIEIQKIS